jgi:hypothetical protein
MVFSRSAKLSSRDDGRVAVKGVDVRDWPDKPFRAIKMYLPGCDNIPYFKRFVRDFMALHKYNTLVMEMNASMGLKRHPELNPAWLEFARDANYSRRNYPPGTPHDLEPNSSYQDTADGGFLEKSEVVALAAWGGGIISNLSRSFPPLPIACVCWGRTRTSPRCPAKMAGHILPLES